MLAPMPAAVMIDLNPGRYQTSLNTFRDVLSTTGTAFLQAQLLC
jgi:hypothetical protein